MNGVHDMGGMHGFGKVEPEPDEPVFHAPWEGRVLAMNRAMGYLGLWSIDVSRFSRETLPPHVYLGSSYYRKWTLGLENLCVQFGLVGDDELAAGHAVHPAKPVRRTRRRPFPAAITTGRRRRRRNSSQATACAPSTSTRRAIPACRAMPGDTAGSSNGSGVATCFRTRSRTAQVRTPTGSTLWFSTDANCGARPPIRPSGSRSRRGSPI